MAKHDMVDSLMHSWRDLRPAPGKKDGCKCDICGLVFLWRSKVKPFEIQTGGIESALSMDKIESAIEVDRKCHWGRCNGDLNLKRQLSDGRSNEDLLRCPRCYEARCSTCKRTLLLQDYLWANCCRYCGGRMLPIFSRRSPPLGDAITEVVQPILCVQDPTVNPTFPTVNPTTSRLVMPIKVQEHRMYEIPIQFQCPCCREIWGGYFHYLSWELPDNWRMDPMTKAHLVISRDTDLCGRRCRTGDGTNGHMDTAIFCKCVGTARYGWGCR